MLPPWGRPSRHAIWCILEPKSAALVAAVFVDFPVKKCNFLHKNKLGIASIALWKSAPVGPGLYLAG